MRRRLALLAGCLALAAGTPATASAAEESRTERVAMSDGVELAATVSGAAPLAPRPTLVEFSPYGRGTGTLDAGPKFNHLLVQIRGTGDSDGSFDALGPRTQRDVKQMLRWACRQPWSNGRLAINGFSASAITIYNSLHRKLPCVRAAVLRSGTIDLYRDLIWPGGVSNLVPAAAVMTMIGAPALIQGPDRLIRDATSIVDIVGGLLDAGLTGLLTPSIDGWWRERRFRGNANSFPVLVLNGFFDVESRGAFEGYRKLRRYGAHLVVAGAHDGYAGGTDGGVAEARAWLDRYVRGVRNGVEDHPRVQLWLADGRREDMAKGKVVPYEADDWPVPGTRWEALALDAVRSRSALSLNDGSLSHGEARAGGRQIYAALPSLPIATDQPNVSTIGISALTEVVPALSRMALTEPLSLTYTTPPLREDVLVAGPASLEVRLASTAPETAIWAVISDVAPNGDAHPVGLGRLSIAYPDINRRRSLVRDGEVVQPHGVYARKQPARVGEERLYRVEIWPIGNRFAAGHRLRLQITGASALSMPSLPALNTVRVGPGSGSRLLLPVLPESDLGAALP